MAEGSYDYYAAYPLPNSSQDGVAYYSLPSIQDGSTLLKNAIMVAHPTQGISLTEGGDEELDLSFVHKLHILKITIPESKNLLGEPIRKLEITFPVNVVGDLALDITDVDAPVELSNGSNVLELNFNEAVNAGDVVYAVIAPVDASQGEISFKAYSELRESEVITTQGKLFEEAHTTPIRLTIPYVDKVTRIYFYTGENFLGETPNTITVSLNDGAFPGGETSVTFNYVDGGTYEYLYRGEYIDNVSGRAAVMSFDSDNCLVSRGFTMPNIIVYGRNYTSKQDVPYLLSEDFSGISSTFENGTVHTTSDAGERSAISLAQYGLNDWYGARIGGGQGLNLRIASRIEMGLFVTNRNKGRVDSPVLSGIKAGKSISIKVEYNYAGDRYESVGSGGFPVYSAGCSESVVQKGDNSIERVAVSSVVLSIDGPNANGTYYGNTPHYNSYTIDGCSNATRVCWSLTNNRSASFAGNGMYWLYIDNVKVSVAN